VRGLGDGGERYQAAAGVDDAGPVDGVECSKCLGRHFIGWCGGLLGVVGLMEELGSCAIGGVSLARQMWLLGCCFMVLYNSTWALFPRVHKLRMSACE
jgi:hypothetical protein